MIRVSVVMPVFNCAEFISDSISSVLEQSFTNFELIIIDDCSTDNTLEICRSFSDSRIILKENDVNLGPASTLNIGFSMAKGEFIAVMHGDDICSEKRLYSQVKFMETNPTVEIQCAASWLFYDLSNTCAIAKDCIITMIHFNWHLLFRNEIIHSSVLMRREVFFLKKIYYSEGMRLCEDYDFWLKCLAQNCRIACNPEKLLFYRIHPNQASSVNSAQEYKMAEFLRRKHWKLITNKSNLSYRYYKFLIIIIEMMSFLNVDLANQLKFQLMRRVWSNNMIL
jgi:glycosyltransferase involved in cell wall biosynthesis